MEKFFHGPREIKRIEYETLDEGRDTLAQGLSFGGSMNLGVNPRKIKGFVTFTLILLDV